ncbi:MAG: ROK family protein, partial [Geminicoccaceae bacterium]
DCLDIGGSGIKGACARGAADLLPLGRVATPLGDLDAFVAAIKEVLARSPAGPAATVAISIAGVVDPDSGRIKVANIPCLDGLPLAAVLTGRLARPVVVGNDGDCFALAEAVAGAGRAHRIVFGAILGTGVGGGLVIDGRLVTGRGGYAGEWGHAPVAATRVGTPPVELPRFPCGCGLSGCVDTLGGARGLERLHAHLGGPPADSVAIVAGWRAGDATAARTVDCYMEIVAPPLALVVNVVGADIVPVGGGLAGSPQLIERLDREVRGRLLRRTDRPLVVPARLAIEPALIGAAILAGAR